MKDATLNKIAKKLKTQYVLFFILPFLFVLYGEFLGQDLEIYSGKTTKMGFYLQTTSILFTMISVPLALKAFHWILINKMDKTDQLKDIKKYIFLSAMRLTLLQLSTLINLVVYYLTDNSTGGLCALISITATLFCIPTKKRITQEFAMIYPESIEIEDIEDKENE